MKALLAVVLCAASAVAAWAQDARAPEPSPEPVAKVGALVQIPPTVADVVVLLNSYKPDVAKVERLRAEVNRPAPEGAGDFDLAQFWHRKSNAALDLGDTQGRYDMLRKALVHAEKVPSSSALSEIGSLLRVRQDLTTAIAQTVGFSAGVEAIEKFLSTYETASPGSVLNMRCVLSANYIALGDLERAAKAFADAERAFNSLRTSARSATVNYGSTWSTFLEEARGNLQLAQGKTDDAMRSYAAAERASQQMIVDSERNRAAGRFGMEADRTYSLRDRTRVLLAKAYVEKQRYNEAELLLRDTLKTVLTREGRNTVLVASTLSLMSRIYAERGRDSEAVLLSQWANRTMDEAGIVAQSLFAINIRLGLANLYANAGRFADAAPIYDAIQRVVASDARAGREVEVVSTGMVVSYVEVGRSADASAAADKLLASSIRSYGADHYKTAVAHGYRALALKSMGQREQARTAFELSMRTLLEPDGSAGDGESSAGKSKRLARIINGYLDLLVGKDTTPSPADSMEAFRVADVVRWQSVQKAVSGSALRSAASTPELAARIKTVQDFDDELQSVYKNLISLRSAPQEKQLPGVIAAMEARISTIKKEQAQALADIRKGFPKYDTLVNPRPAALATARAALRPNEALLSIYVTDSGSYVWATGSAPDAGLQFHFSPVNRRWLAGQVKRLRDAVDLGAVSSVARMKFDLEAAHAIYRALLAPVAGAWAQSDTLLVVANDALGQIPFSMLVTAPTQEGSAGPAGALSQYRPVPWLVRNVAVAYMPSVSALVTQRAVPAAKADRQAFMGFGDPDFGGRDAQQGAVASRGVRNLGVGHAPRWEDNPLSQNLRSLETDSARADQWKPVPEIPALPDTRDEITAIAKALSADLGRDTVFGAQANVQSVVNANLRSRRIVAFATHGLIAGDLPGLEQPALALAPVPGQDIYSGLLKLDDVLKLSLDADLVVLSACNTAAADGGGSEAVSGLGRGFFYAGSRSVLATHWPVETVSARQLVTHLFEGYAHDTTMTRAKALQRAMLDVLDKDTETDANGRVLNTYAHPAYWAPYALYGDPGR